MGKRNCCVPGCASSWRNSPGLTFHSLPKDIKVLTEYKRLIGNVNLKEFSANTKICGKHFEGGERVCRTQLPSIFPWSKPAKRRREIIKHALPEKIKTLKESSSSTMQATNLCEATTEAEDDIEFADVINNAESIPDTKNDGQEQSESELSEKVDLHNECKEKAEMLQENVNFLQNQYEKLKYKVENEPKFDIDVHKDCDEDITFFTGFPNYSSMAMCFDLLKEKAANLSYGGRKRLNFVERKSGTKRKLSLWQEFTLVLLRLRLGLFERDLAERFGVSVSTVSDIFRTWIKFMKHELQPLCIVWPTKEQLKFYMPSIFKELYPELVSIIDCTEIRMESPSSLDKQSVCYSSYKAHTTMKGLIGITPNGVVSFASELYCGSISDPDIVEKSGFLNHIQKGDFIMADKGFIIQDQLATIGANLVKPNFLSDKCQFTKLESEHNKKVASLRIHVERYMERLKNWHYFDRVIPISTSSIASDAWIVIACLSNFWPPIIS